MSRPFFSESSGHEYGTFYHHLGLVQHSLTPEIGKILQASLNEDFSWRDNRTEEELVRLAYEVISLFHETRHLYDAFGTLAGISLFAAQMALLKDFCIEMKVLKAENLAWSLPLSDWAKGTEVPQPRRDFIRRAHATHVGTKMFVAAFQPVSAEGHILELLVKADGPGGGLDAFPLRILKMFEGRNTPMTVFYPLGFETMLEGNAHAIARNMAGHYFPEFVADELLMAIHAVEHPSDAEGASNLSAAMPPYMVVDLLISRFMQSKGIDQFPRNIVFGLIDIVLSQSWLEIIEVAPGTTGAKFDNLGGLLVEALHEQSIDELREGRVTAHESIDKGYRALLGELEKGGDWDTVQDDLSPLSSVKIWESYVAQHLTVPLLRARVESGHDAFRTYGGYLELLGKMGRQPISVLQGRISFDLPERVIHAWGHVTMIAGILHQLLEGTASVECPRRFERIPGIAAINFAAEGHCDRFAAVGCGRFEQGVFAPSPPCHFEDIVMRCGLKR